MKNLILLSMLTLVGCGAENAALTNNELVKSVETPEKSCKFEGTFTLDSLTFDVYEGDGYCAFSLNCGASGKIVDSAVNEYTLIDFNNSQYCEFPNTFTTEGKIKTINFGNFNGQWLGTILSSQVGNVFTKIN